VGGPPSQTATLPGSSDDPHELRKWPGINTQCVVDRTLIRRGRRSLAFMLRALPFCGEARIATLMIRKRSVKGMSSILYFFIQRSIFVSLTCNHITPSLFTRHAGTRVHIPDT